MKRVSPASASRAKQWAEFAWGPAIATRDACFPGHRLREGLIAGRRNCGPAASPGAKVREALDERYYAFLTSVLEKSSSLNSSGNPERFAKA